MALKYRIKLAVIIKKTIISGGLMAIQSGKKTMRIRGNQNRSSGGFATTEYLLVYRLPHDLKLLVIVCVYITILLICIQFPVASIASVGIHCFNFRIAIDFSLVGRSKEARRRRFSGRHLCIDHTTKARAGHRTQRSADDVISLQLAVNKLRRSSNVVPKQFDKVK